MISARFKRALMAGAAVPLALFAAAPAEAHKPSTHIYLSEEAIRDMLDDGKVTIYRVDWQTGQVVGELGAFDVDPRILAAVRSSPRQFRAGVIGPDGYPDILTGQQIIHPEEAHSADGHANGSNAWLTHVWQRGFRENSDPRVNAFAVGYLAHAAGDIFAHTYVNHFTGGEFMLTPNPTNGIKHIVLEGYIGQRTPSTRNVFPTTISVGTICHGRKREDLGQDLDGEECRVEQRQVHEFVSFEDVSIDGVEGFIHDELVYGAPGSALSERLLVGPNVNKSIPAIFSTLRNGLAEDVARYDRERLELTGPARVAYSSFHGPKAEYKRAWIEDIDEGLAAWPQVSHQLATKLVFTNPGPADISGAMDVIGAYKSEHLLSMFGAPDALIATTQFIADCISAILPLPLREGLAELQKDIVKALIGVATGTSAEDWGAYLSAPDTKFDEVLNSPGGDNNGGVHHRIDLEAFNRDELHISDRAYTDRTQRFEVNTFAPAFNTLQLTKMTFLGEAGVRQLAASLQTAGAAMEAVPGDFQNVMLGWVASLDAGSQADSPNPAERPLFAANDGAAYRNLFMRMTGEAERPSEHGSSGVEPGTVPEPPVEPPVEAPDEHLPPPGGEGSGSLPPGSGPSGSTSPGSSVPGGWGEPPSLPAPRFGQSIEGFAVSMVSAEVLATGVVDVVLSIRNETDDSQPIVGSLFHLNLVDVDGLGTATVAPLVAETGAARSFPERVDLAPGAQMDVRFQFEPHQGHGPLSQVTVRVNHEEPAVFDVSSLRSPRMSDAAAGPSGGTFVSLTDFDIRIDRIVELASGGAEIFYTVRNTTHQVQQMTGATISFRASDANGGEQASLRNFFPTRGAQRPRLLENSVFVEPGSEAHLRTYFSRKPQGPISVTDDVITQPAAQGS